MLARKTVFVIGAGASHEFGLPLGLDLLDKIHKTATDAAIAQDIGRNHFFMSLLNSGIQNINSDLQNKLRIFTRGLPLLNSIDRYLDFHRDNPELVAIGKFAITYQILLSERTSNMRIDKPDSQPLAEVSKTYIRSLFSLMTEGTDPSCIESMFKNVSFICFNYDRCIEAYFFLAIRALLNCSGERAAEICSKLKIFHPYGTVGKLHNSYPPRDNISDFLFGTENAIPVLSSRSWQMVRTFTENMDDEITLNNIHKTISEADRIVFIGFSFLDQNMKLLTPSDNKIQAQEIMATSLGLSQSDTDILQNYLVKNFLYKMPNNNQTMGMRARLYNQTASQFISSEANYLRL